jgi:anhydro-N-acetylmuramic acid kinase
MSGTSMDGVDGVLLEVEGSAGVRLRGHIHRPFDSLLRAELMALNTPGGDELHRAATSARGLAHAYASAVDELIRQCAIAGRDVRAIGAHGQTVRHRPDAGYSLQLFNGALLAERTGIDVVCDLRSRDIAAGGQGAPLVPAFHAAVFGASKQVRAVLNLGGISNLTVLAPERAVIGFDCGPANVLLDGWCERHRGATFDDDGRWAAGGRVDPRLLRAMLSHPYFGEPPPKSTGRDLFGLAWLDAFLASQAPGLPAQDVQATLAALTVESVARDIERHAPETDLLYVCGGGARNGHLMRSLATRLAPMRVATTAELGVPVDQVEAAAFAWLAHCFIERRPGNLPSVTGARGPRILGALYPA